MTTYCITGIHGLTQNIAGFQPDFILSIRDSRPLDSDIASITRSLETAPAGAQIVVHAYDDINAMHHGSVWPNLPVYRELAQTLAARRYAPERVLVHCSAGISRSSAATAFIMGWIATQIERKAASPELADKIIDDLYLISRNIDPNMRIIGIGERVLSELGADFGHRFARIAQRRITAEQRMGKTGNFSW